MSRLNNFDALRLLGAAAVLVGHAYHLTGRPENVPFVLGFPVHTLGVVVFFSISGYLITASWTRSRDLVMYTAARCLRIFPGLVAVVLVCAFAVGPKVTQLSVGSYLTSPTTWDYLRNTVMYPIYTLPGVWTDLPYPGAVNGALWTLPAEFFCYLVVPALCFFAPRGVKVFGLAGFLVVAVLLSRVPAGDSEIVWGTRITDAALMWTFFAAGALICIAEEYWPGILRVDLAVIAIGSHLLVMALWPTQTVLLSFVFLPYVVLVMGHGSTSVLRRASRFGDFSYGLYLWGFPVQQLVVAQFGVRSMSVNLLIVGALTTVAAFVSWHLVEAPSLRLKSAIGRRRRERRSARRHDRPGAASEPVDVLG